MPKNFHALFDEMPERPRFVNADVPVHTLTLDSRAAGPGTCFAALVGTTHNGHSFLADAYANGCRIFLVSKLPHIVHEDASYAVAADTSAALGYAAHAFFGHPTRHMHVVGVTGTNGKTTVTTLLHRLFTALGYECGLIGTTGNLLGTEPEPATHTTPDAIALNALLARMAAAGCSHVFMEVSSHAAHQRRIAGLSFSGGVFTNLTHDHLDYHGTFVNYRDAKKLFFDGLPATAFAITNKDDANGPFMLQNTAASRHTYALKSHAELTAHIMENTALGLHLHIDGREMHTALIGEFNAYNLLATYAVAVSLNEPKEDVLRCLSALAPPAGRFQTVPGPLGILGIVDYAHTPDALQNVLETLNQVRAADAEIITVVGCGGDRDKAKRPTMACMAATLGQRAILTSDNPRTEDPETILDDMWAGVPQHRQGRTLRIANRRQAIRTAVQLATPGSLILVAGKGHETYQEVQHVRNPFNDVAELAAAFAALQPNHPATPTAH